MGGGFASPTAWARHSHAATAQCYMTVTHKYDKPTPVDKLMIFIMTIKAAYPLTFILSDLSWPTFCTETWYYEPRVAEIPSSSTCSTAGQRISSFRIISCNEAPSLALTIARCANLRLCMMPMVSELDIRHRDVSVCHHRQYALIRNFRLRLCGICIFFIQYVLFMIPYKNPSYAMRVNCLSHRVLRGTP